MGFFETDFLTYLPLSELRVLKLTCHTFNNAITEKLINNNIKQKIHNHLYTILKEDLGLLELLKKVNAFISGSFIIQSILNEHYDYSDIDIYIPYTQESAKLLDDYIKYESLSDTFSYGTLLTESDTKILRVVDYRLNPQVNDGYSEEFKEEKYVTLSNCPHDRLQLIYVDIKPGEEQEYVNNFDFDVCKNYFNFKNVYVKNVNQLLSKHLIYKHGDWDYEKTIDRAKKYKERGFKVTIPYTFHEFIKSKYKVTIIEAKLIKETDHYYFCQIDDIEKDSKKYSKIAIYLSPHKNDSYYKELKRYKESIHPAFKYSLPGTDNNLNSNDVNNPIKLFKELNEKNNNVISLSKNSRNTLLDFYLNMYYDQPYQILWSGHHYYVFLMS